ncbi:tryptophan synthase subunit alpha [Oceanobacillus jeddahense]|uniref:Tryptophan synthase alpha chain n=1 Tax=Oceanobacillus jeddahense TaxID=1462527 RepID=A0ABY5JYC7_9BACI|nr:tryptophan synthase subunit alpha [Oceanobacillus jeddahense]UUI04061.1 tryptophan synthase subunit alpha [Oceanobacillus jeddahense]
MGKHKLENTLNQIKATGKPLFVPYMMAGDGGINQINERIHFLEECGASAIELGIPFSDPVADGPVIQDAGLRALREGTTLKLVLDEVRKQKETRNIPIILMTYINPIWSYGYEQFAKDCDTAGVDGIIIPDIPMEEEKEIAAALSDNSIAFIRLAAMTSPDERLKRIAQISEGFLYAVSVNGTTGERQQHDENTLNYLKRLTALSNVPVLAGFGISNPDQAKSLASYCDGVIVGSKIVHLFAEEKQSEIKKLISETVQ